jgi:ABC-2 type transport system permease protein
MLIQIARFEFRYLLRNPLVWLTAAGTFALLFIGMSVEGFELGSEGGLLENAAYATLRNYLMLSLAFMFVTTSFVANVIIRDDETGFGPIIRSTRITKLDYVAGRFLGAFAVAAMLTLFAPLGIVVGTMAPWADPAQFGPNRLADHLFAYFVLALPNIFVHSAIFFALATITRSMMATYLGVISFVSGFFFLQDAFSSRPQLSTVIGIADPFASRTLQSVTRYWTIAERNTMLPELSGLLLYNRLFWLAIAVIFLVLAYSVFRFADQGMSKRERKKQKLVEAAGDPLTIGATATAGSLPAPRHNRAALRALLWLRTKFEMKQVFVHPAFPVLMAWGMYVTIFVLLTQRYPDWMPEYPTTLSLIPEIEDAFHVIPLVVAIYYAGELVWRERDRRVHELIDASPLPNWAYVVPKTAALGLVFLSMLLCNVLASVILQLSLGFTNVELGKYVLWYVLPASFDSMLLAALAIFIQSLSPHKAVGWGIMTLFLIWKEINKTINHNLLLFGGTPDVPLSDLNGAGTFWIGAWTFRLYWGALAVLMLVAAHLLWRRGTEIRLMPRLARAPRRLAGGAGVVATAAFLTFVGTGAYAYYNTNVLNEYRTKEAGDEDAAEYERRFGKYRGLPRPTLEELTLDIDLYPSERRAVVRGGYLLRNREQEPIRDIHVRMSDEEDVLDLTTVTMEGARPILNDTEFDYQIHRLDRPMQPGEERLLKFEAHRQDRGFRNEIPSTEIVANGTFLSNYKVMPIIGMDNSGLHQDPELRRKYGLPGLILPPKLEDVSATYRHSFGTGWIRRSVITVSTDAEQTPIAPGKRVSDSTNGGRRTARFVTTAPIRPRFSVQSARYAEKHRRYRGIDFAVYYHPQHAWNVDRMLDAMQASLDIYQANYGPYQFDHFRIVEFPAYHGFAQAFAGTIPFSESVGFIADYTKPDTLDYVTGITAHEFAHMWWPNQILPAETEGYTVLVETLAQYSAHMVIKKLRGEDQMRRYLQFELDRYLQGRAWAEEEPTLARTLGQDYLAYRKGAVAMYLLQKRLGEEAVNRALRNFLDRYRFRWTPFPRTLELIAALRAEAKTAEHQALITDLFERITLYDLEVAQPTVTRRADGKWDVTVPVNAKKLYADSKGAETETPLNERIEVGLFTAEPGIDAFDKSHVVLMERRPIRSGSQVLKFVTDKKPLYAGVDPYNFYIDRDSADNVAAVN